MDKNTMIDYDEGSQKWVKKIEKEERNYRKKLRAKAIAYVYMLWEKNAPKNEKKDFNTICNMVNYSLMFYEGEDERFVNEKAREMLLNKYNVKID